MHRELNGGMETGIQVSSPCRICLPECRLCAWSWDFETALSLLVIWRNSL